MRATKFLCSVDQLAWRAMACAANTAIDSSVLAISAYGAYISSYQINSESSRSSVHPWVKYRHTGRLKISHVARDNGHALDKRCRGDEAVAYGSRV